MAASTKYPLPVFHFQIQWGGDSASFSEVSGLNVETQVIEYRHGDSVDYSVLKMPGMQKYGNITMKRGTTQKTNTFWDWWFTHKLNTIERRTVTISLLDENHAPAVTWSIKNAWPVKVDGGSYKSTGNEVAIESIELAHEGITISN